MRVSTQSASGSTDPTGACMGSMNYFGNGLRSRPCRRHVLGCSLLPPDVKILADSIPQMICSQQIRNGVIAYLHVDNIDFSTLLVKYYLTKSSEYETFIWSIGFYCFNDSTAVFQSILFTEFQKIIYNACITSRTCYYPRFGSTFSGNIFLFLRLFEPTTTIRGIGDMFWCLFSVL